MNPEDGVMHVVADGPDGRRVIAETGEDVPDSWPVFTVGEVIVVKGFPFRIARINRSSLVVQPTLGDKPPRVLVSALTSGIALPLSRQDAQTLARCRGHGWWRDGVEET